MRTYSNPLEFLRKSLKGFKGQTLVEYSLLLILIAIVVILAVQFVGQQVNNTYNNIGTHVPEP